MRTPVLPAIALALVAAACVAPGAEIPEGEPTVGLQEPTFAPLTPSTADGTASPTASPTTPPAPTPSPTGDTVAEDTPVPVATPTATGTPTTAPSAPVRGSLTDGTGDMDGLHRSRAPGHADLRAVALEMGPENGTIHIEFAAPAPEHGAGDEIVNVATYHDVTGDGRVDYEVWASLTSEGWGTSWFDLRAGTARFAADDDVEVAVESGALVLTFPSSHLDGARTGQWLASSEWGTGLMMSTGTTVTDDAPDDRSGRRWPN